MDIAEDLKRATHEMPAWGWFVLGLGGLLLVVLHMRGKAAVPSGAPVTPQTGVGATDPSGMPFATAGSVLSAVNVLQLEDTNYAAQFALQQNSITSLQAQIAALLAQLQAGGGGNPILQPPPHVRPNDGDGNGDHEGKKPPRYPYDPPPGHIPVDIPPTHLPPIYVVPPPPPPVNPSPLSPATAPAIQGAQFSVYNLAQRYPWLAAGGGLDYNMGGYQLNSDTFHYSTDPASFFQQYYANHPTTGNPRTALANVPIQNTQTPRPTVQAQSFAQLPPPR